MVNLKDMKCREDECKKLRSCPFFIAKDVGSRRCKWESKEDCVSYSVQEKNHG